MRNKVKLSKKILEKKENLLVHSLGYSNANNRLAPRLITTSFLHANTNTEEGLSVVLSQMTDLT